MYRRSTARELRRYGVPHRVVGSSWYQSSNTACVYPRVRLRYDWRDEVRRSKEAHFRSFARPGRIPLTGDGENTLRITGGRSEQTTAWPPRTFADTTTTGSDALRLYLMEARYHDWLDERRTIMAKTPKTPKTAKTKALPAADTPLEVLLIDNGFVPNRYLLEMNHSLQVNPNNIELDDPWNLPSRLMRFPLEVQLGKDGLFHIGLMHPLLGDHPFVKTVAEAIKPHKIDPNGAPNSAGYSAAPNTWHHAVDLIEHDWQALLRTRQFTTDTAIVNAVHHALGKQGPFGTEEAREVLEAVGAEPPADTVATVLKLAEPSHVVDTGRRARGGPGYWPINSVAERDPVALAWLRVWGIEARWFDYTRSGHLNWSEHGRAMYAAVSTIEQEKSAAE